VKLILVNVNGSRKGQSNILAKILINVNAPTGHTPKNNEERSKLMAIGAPLFSPVPALVPVSARCA